MSFQEPAFPEVVDSTMRSSFASCPQSFYQGYIHRRSPKGGSIHLIAGGAYARGLELMRTYIWGPEKLSLDEAWMKAAPQVIAEFGDFAVPAGSEHKSLDRVLKALIAYFDRFPPATDHMQPYMKKNGFPAVEFTFSFPTRIMHPETGNPILYAGRFDMVGVYNDLPWVVDDKTATSLGPSWDRQWSIRGQLVGYCFAAQQHGIPVEGAIVRGASFLKTGAYGFSEPIIYVADWQLMRWWIQLNRDIHRMVQCWNSKSEEYPYGYWDWNLADTCTNWGGCPYLQLCSVANPDAWVEGYYEPGTWNPLDVNPGREGQIKNEMPKVDEILRS